MMERRFFMGPHPEDFRRHRDMYVTNKYHAKKVVFDGITFDSRKEGLYYLKLKDMERRGEISNLRLQIPYELLPAIYRDEVVHLKTKDKVVQKLVQRAVYYVADFVCYDHIIVELKALEKLTMEHQYQVLNYLNITQKKLGLLINFGESPLKFKRLIM